MLLTSLQVCQIMYVQDYPWQRFLYSKRRATASIRVLQWESHWLSGLLSNWWKECSRSVCTDMGQSLRHTIREKSTVWTANTVLAFMGAVGTEGKMSVYACKSQRYLWKDAHNKWWPQGDKWMVQGQGRNRDLHFATYAFVPIEFL